MKKLLIGLMLVSFMVSAKTISEDIKEEVGRYKIEITTYVNSKNSKTYVLETIFDTKTGKVIERKRFYHTKYGDKKRK
tara:strand:- start:521 stop:754 length:234 start_codon:yes stop_codon:yes gene_type:complete